jgi:hypothetical protein
MAASRSCSEAVDWPSYSIIVFKLGLKANRHLDNLNFKPNIKKGTFSLTSAWKSEIYF